MIVRDAERDLPDCLASVRGLVDEIVIADTGSADSTREIAVRQGARLLQIAWNDDFAQARNQALAVVLADWVLVLDADEELDPEAKSSIPKLVSAGDVAGYLVTIRNYVSGLQERIWDRPAKPNDSRLQRARAYPAYVEHENVRLFRRDPQVYFVGRVHETVGHRIGETGGKLARAGFAIHHFGLAASPQTRARKNTMYRELGRRKIRERPQDAQAHLELGLVEFDNFHNYQEALLCFHRSCELNPKLGVNWLFAALAALRLERYEPALTYIRGAQGHGYNSPLVLETEGDAQYNLGNFGEAGRLYRKANKSGQGSPLHPNAPKTGTLGAPLLESKLAMAELRCGETDTALRRLRRALREAPHAPELHDRLITALAFVGKLYEAAQAAENKLAEIGPDESSFLRAASIWAKLREWQKAESNVAFGLRQFPHSERLRHALAEVQVLCGRNQPGSA
jgi:glycosyltransferase involved in cell wall biosynthesis